MDNLPDDFRLAYLLNTRLETEGLLAGICRELGVDPGNDADVNKLVERIYDNLLAAHAGGRHTLVVIEEAQNLGPGVLETLRLLTNLETSATKLMHILLIGQPELLETLRQPGLRQLNQRVVSRSHLGALDRDEIARYLRHRLKMAGTERPLFTAGAIARLHARSGGIPRLVNLLAEHCLMGAYATGRSQVNAGIVRRAARELAGTLPPPRRAAGRGLAVAATVLLGLGLALYLGLPGVGALMSSGPVDTGPAGGGTVAVETAVAAAPAVTEPATAGGQGGKGVAEETQRHYPNAYRRLLARRGIDAEVASEAGLCEVAEARGLRCMRGQVRSREELLAVGRPMVVRLYSGDDGIDLFLLDGAGTGGPILANSRGERDGRLDEILQRMDPEVLYLWQSPPAYTAPLSPGESNPSLVKQVVEWLAAAGYATENLVTGGLYSNYVAALVREFQADNGLEVDGILGERTLEKLSLLAGPADRVSDAE